MLSDLPVVWNKRLVGFSTTSSGVEAAFEDGTVVAGSVLVGTDGSGSEVRRILTPENHQLKQLPARCLGVSIRARHTEIAELLEIDPMLFMATHPGTHDFLWWSVLEMPEDKEEGEYTVLVSISWPVFGEADEVPVTAREQVAGMKRRARGFVDVLKRAVEAVPDDAVPFEIRVADWELVEWGDGGGRVTLAGDAAHAMTMCKYGHAPFLGGSADGVSSWGSSESWD